MSPPKVNLIYIASIGRSGTTLFESILGAHSQVATMGEVHIWPHELEARGVQPCGSGLFVDEDPFWCEMKRRVDPFAQPSPQLHHFREFHNHGYTLRPSALRDFRPGPVSARRAAQIDQYGKNNALLCNTFADLVEENTGQRPDWVVDASKDPYRLQWLIRSGYFNIKVLHMVKRPAGFVYSVTKQWLTSKDRFRALKRLYYTSRQSLAWVIQNQLFSLTAANHLDDSTYRLIQYEELAAKPEKTVADVCDLVGIPYEARAISNFREGSPFAIAGNPMRYRSGGIYLDEKWRTNLPSSSRRLAGLITGPTRARYGY